MQVKSHQPYPQLSRPLHLVIIGPPGSGKGTQAPLIVATFNIRHLATGDMLRKEVATGSPIGLHIKQIIDKGGFIDDETMINLIKTTIESCEMCKNNGYILDGFPRTLNQAQKLDELLREKGEHIDRVIELVVDDSLLVRRIAGRLIHPGSGRCYHEELNPPLNHMKDDITGEDLVRRADDNVETLSTRLSTYHLQTSPVVEYYKKSGLLLSIDALPSPDKVFGEILKGIHEKSLL